MLGAFLGHSRLWQNLGTGLKAGLRIEDALAHAARGVAPWARLARALRDTGRPSLAEAVAALPGRFTELEVAVVQAGEMSGTLPETLARLGGYLEERGTERGKVLARVAYPVIIVHLAAFAGTVAPAIRSGGSSMAGGLAGTALALIPFYAITLALFVLPRALRRAGEGFARAVDGALLRLPLVGRYFRYEAETEFYWLAGTLLGAGVPIRETMAFATERLTNRAFRAELDAIAADCRAGEPLAESLDQRGVLSPSARARLATAESVGTLADSFLGLFQEARGQRGLVGQGIAGAVWALYFFLAVAYTVWALAGFWGGYIGAFSRFEG